MEVCLTIVVSQIAAAKAWTNWEMATSYLVPNEDSLKRGENEQFALVLSQSSSKNMIL